MVDSRPDRSELLARWALPLAWPVLPGWPTREFPANAHRDKITPLGPIGFVATQHLVAGPLGFSLALARVPSGGLPLRRLHALRERPHDLGGARSDGPARRRVEGLEALQLTVQDGSSRNTAYIH